MLITESQNGQSFSCAVGDTVVIELTENPTTGFRWDLVANDPHILSPIGDDYSIAPSGNIGGGGKRTLRFRVLKAGTVALKLVHRRAWEVDAPRSTFEITLISS